MERVLTTRKVTSYWNHIKLDRSIPIEIQMETEEKVLKNITKIDLPSNPVRIRNKELQRSLYSCRNIIPFVESIMNDVSFIIDHDIFIGLLNNEGTLVCSSNRSKVGLCCSDSAAFVQSNSAWMKSLFAGNALQINSVHGGQSGGFAILDNDDLMQYLLYARNDSGPLSANSWNVLYLATQLIQQHYSTLQLLEENTLQFVRAITDPALLLDVNLNVVTANEPCLKLLDIDYSNPSSELFNISLISNYRHITNLASILTAEHRIVIKTRNKFMTCDIKNRQLIENPYGKQLLLLFDKALNAGSNWSAENHLTVGSSNFDTIIGNSPSMQKIKSLAKQVAKSSCTILIEGDTGTGKELLVEAIHMESGRKGRFVAVNCGGIPSELLQSELFGYEEGAFTGAKKGGKLGQIELADGGTVFLDEIGEMPIEMQVSLLRFIQNKTINRIGSETSRKVDVRIIAATNRSLKNEVKQGNFRKDLLYRLNVISFQIPALKERREDIPLIANYLLENLCYQYDAPIMKISDQAMNVLMNYNWPGNIRELANVVERAFLLRQNEELVFDDILRADEANNEILDRTIILDNTEKEIIEKYLEIYQGKISLTANALDMTRQTLYRKIKKLNINREAFS